MDSTTAAELLSLGSEGTKPNPFCLSDMPNNTEQDASFIDGDAKETKGMTSYAAPIYSFDEDGDILNPREISPFTPNNSVESECENISTIVPKSEKTIVSAVENLRDQAKDLSEKVERFVENGSEAKSKTSKPSTPRLRKFGVVIHSANNKSTEEGQQVPPFSYDSTPVATSEGGSTPTPNVNIVLEKVPSVPKIDFHAPSIEVVDDYLEGHLEDDNQFKDLCSSLFGDAGLGAHQIGSNQGSCLSLLSANPPQEQQAPKRQRVPFDTVVFTERKPSTGDALIQSLGLGLTSDGSDTIQDIASKNQGAARERLQLASEGSQCEAAGLTRHCESCGISPEDCLKKLGLHSERERLLSPSPKSEKLWQLFQQIQAGLFRSTKNRRPSGSEPELDKDHCHHHHTHPVHVCHSKMTPTKSRSLESTPMHSPITDIRKPMMNTV